MLLADQKSTPVFPSPRPLRITGRRGAGAWADVLSGIQLWRLWGRLGWNDILQRYRRSLLGPLWLTASMAIMVIALGVLYAQLFQQRIDDFLPYFCVGILVWTLMASYLTESGTLFTGSESYIKQIALPFSVYVYKSSWAKLIIFAHNFVIYFGVLLYFRIWPGSVGLLALPGLLIVAVNGTAASLTIGMISARFRDIPQVIASVVQIVFFLTPIFWKADLLKGRHAYVIDFNPFFHLVQVVRAPLLGEYPTAANYFAVLLITLINVGSAAWLFSRFRTRITYWI
ncbi:ABC transporter permease [Bradyrhizobium japonicum]|uniref:ABC transporter permease n=1 Tax=Bradyrhizobium japonicum TaxID=375 RepID=UPI00200EFFEF|nr:ABC transporter permease [Bradyrhizobium japonicum]UQE03672.1 ABC transporter permease [Bradyrhizobium japonicum]